MTSAKSPNDLDADIQDLLPDDDAVHGSSEMQPLNLDNLIQGEVDVPVKYQPNQSCTLCALCCAYFSYGCEHAPRFCWTVGVIALVIPFYLLVTAVFMNPTEHFGVIGKDYSNIQSQYDLTIGEIDHWCITGDNDSCRCEDPLQPEPMAEFKAWTKAHTYNKKNVDDLIQQGKANPDIAFLGAAIVEVMVGRYFGEERGSDLSELKELFDHNFGESEDGKLDAVALGIAGDNNASILWRLLNGEMPPGFKPKIWWLELGMNDLGRAQCSEEVVVLGYLRIVEEILKNKPDSTIVINSMLPMAMFRGGLKPLQNDFKTLRAQREEHKKNMQKHKESLEKLRQGRNNGNRQLRVFWGGGKYSDKKPVKMKDHQEVQKKFTPITHTERKVPLWTAITAINEQLKKFCTKHDRVFFFDSDEIFASQEEDYWVLRTDMITRKGFPTPKGYKEWESKIIEKAKILLKENSH